MRISERLLPISLACVCALLVAPCVRGEIHFVDRSAEAQVSTQHDNLGLYLDGGEKQNFYGSGVAFEDVNLDGWPDLVLASGETGRSVYLNQHDGTFSDASSWLASLPRSTSTGLALADVDNNGRLDLMMNNYYAEPYFFVGNGASFSEQAAQKGLKPLMFNPGQEPVGYAGPQSMGVAFGDWNHDGLVDIYVANYQPDRRDMFLRAVDGSYFQRTTLVDVPVAVAGFQPVFLDLDDDGDLDIYVANDFAMNFYFENGGPGSNYALTEKAGTYKISGNANWPSDHVMSMGVAIGDFDNDLDLDIYVANYIKNALYVNPDGPGSNGRFQERALAQGVPYEKNTWGTSFLDADNDGDLDLCMVGGWIHSNLALDQGRFIDDRFFENLGAPDYLFANVTDQANFHDLEGGRGLAVADYDRDGRLDVAVWNCSLHDPDVTGDFVFYPGHLRLYHNEGDVRGHWVALRLIGSGAPKTNAAGIGARVYVTAGGRTQMREIRAGESFMSHNSLEAEFGLGDATMIDQVRVRWTTGEEEIFEGVQVDAIQSLVEGTGSASKYGTLLPRIESSFDGVNVRLSWLAAPWLQPSAIRLERSPADADPPAFASVPAVSPQFEGNIGSVLDTSVESEREYLYRLTVESHGGSFVESTIVSAQTGVISLPERAVLRPNVPNPFNPTTNLAFSLPADGRIRLSIYDLRGRELRVLADEWLPRGDHDYEFDGRDRDGNSLASGTYIYALRGPDGTVSRRLTLLR